MPANAISIGWFFSASISLIFCIGAYAQFTFDVNSNTESVQFPEWMHTATALSLLLAAMLNLAPNVSFATLGAIIMTGMIGGMIATLLLQENAMWWTRVPMGLLPWLGLYLRYPEFNNLMSFWR